jgi:hypothetical protein
LVSQTWVLITELPNEHSCTQPGGVAAICESCENGYPDSEKAKI